jgi:citrate synthase
VGECYLPSKERVNKAKEKGISNVDTRTAVNKGLDGVVALESDISRVDGERGILEYRGYNIHDLAEHSTFEEVAYILLHRTLPTKAELRDFFKELTERRELRPEVIGLLTNLCNYRVASHPTVYLRTAISYLGSLDEALEDISDNENMEKGLNFVAKIPTIVAYIQRMSEGKRLVYPNKKLGHAANFLYMLYGVEPDKVEENALNLDLILHSEHGLNASTFSARVSASTLSDMYACVVSATGTLFGQLHGGASQKVIEMLRALKGNDRRFIEKWVDTKLLREEKIMGFGHRVYTTKDPRAEELRRLAKELDILHGNNWTALADELAEIVYHKKRIHPNVDLYAPIVYANLRIPDSQFINMFVMGRIVGWVAHMMEQYQNNKLIRPLQKYHGEKNRAFIPVDKR